MLAAALDGEAEPELDEALELEVELDEELEPEADEELALALEEPEREPAPISFADSTSLDLWG
jgi:hypothetical protein